MSVRDTSLDAYQSIRPQLGARQQAVYDAIRTLGCPTNTELSRYLRLPINQITPRTNELREKGFVTECEKRTCGVTGRTVWSWRVKNG